MSGLRPDSHVAQQFRRDKLRIQNISQHYQDFPNNLQHLSSQSHQGFNNLDLLQVRNVRNANNMLDDEPPPPPAIYSSEISNFSTTTTSQRNPFEYQELGDPSRLMMHQHQYASSFPQQTIDWNVVNYASNTSSTFLASDQPNNVVDSNFMVQNHPPASSYQSALHDVVKSASLMNQTSQQGIWVGEPSSELEQHHHQHQPSFGNQNHSNQSRSFGWTNNPNPLCFTDKKIDGGDSNPHQSLSLSLSSSNACVSQFDQEGSVSRDCGKSPSSQDMVPSRSTSFRNVGPLGPFTGYATILKSSRFLKTSQDLLDEFCCALSGSRLAQRSCDLSERVSGEACGSATSADAVTVNQTGVALKAKASNSASSSSMFHVSNENSGADWGAGTSSSGVSSLLDFQQKKARLLYMQEEVTRRYKQYHQQLQMVVSSFESVAGLNSATPYMSMAFKSVSKHFRCLNNSISDQVKLISQVLGEDLTMPNTSTSSKVDTNNVALRVRCMDQSFQKNNKSSSRGAMTILEQQHHHVWRPQRGLPERSVAILRAWLFEHFLHPYPTDTDKHMLAMQTGLSRNQVSNWFINARVRVWKPMVEEIHTLETKTTGAIDNNSINEGTCDTEAGSTSQQQPRVDKSLSKFGLHTVPENQFQGMEMGSSINAEELNAGQWKSQEKRSKLDYHEMSSSMDGTVMGFLPCRNGGLGSVSLTLGLRHGVEGMQQQQQQQLQEEQLRHHIGGQMMIHDFVG